MPVLFSQLDPLADSQNRWKGRRDCMVVGFTTTYAITESVPITTDVVSLNLDHGEVYNIMW